MTNRFPNVLTRRSVALAGIAGPVLLAHGAARTTAQETTPGDAAFTGEDELAFTTIVADSLAETATPGALVGIWYPGRGTWLHAAGIGDLATAAPVTLDDHLRIASITKTFVATVVLQLADEGQLGLDDTLDAYIPVVPDAGNITLRQILAMSAGIYDFVRDPEIAEGYNADPLMAFEPEDALDIIQASTPDFSPGEKVQYSNSNYLLLGMIIEQVTGQSAEDAITARVIEPLGLTQTSFPTTPEMPDPFAHGYGLDEVDGALPDFTRSNPAVPWTSGAMISTLEDLNTWARALGTGALLSEAIFQERLAWGVLAETPMHVSYGLGILNVNGLVGHNGGIPGYSSWMVYDPEADATLVVVTTRAGSEGGTSDPIFTQLASRIFPDRFPPLPEATPAASRAQSR
jgi:D-alanyl-D-alanine carboxypeptidase